MKVICNRGALLEGLLVAGNVVASRTPKPVLQCIKLTAADDKLTLTATDLEVAIRYSESQVQVEEPGETLLSADKFLAIVRECVDDTLAIETTAGGATIKGADSSFKLYTQNPAEFPPVPEPTGDGEFRLPGSLLKQMINQTTFAVAREVSRYAFNGALVTIKGGRISMVATDTRRLALSRGDLAPGTRGEATAIVPAKALNLIDKLITNPEEEIGFSITENQIHFRSTSATLTSNLVEGQFAPYEEVIPKECNKKMFASTADFLGAIKRAALLTTGDSRGVRLAFSKKGLVLTSRSPESGEAEVKFPCKFEGDDIEIGFNPAFVVDALKVVDTDEITIEMSNPNRPALLKAGANFQYVIMPINLQQ